MRQEVWRLYDKVRDKLVAASSSEAALMRECGWRGISFPSNRYEIESESEDMYNPRWDCYCRPHRYASKWPKAKEDEFVKRYEAFQPMKELEVHFDTAISTLGKRARRLGLPPRNMTNPKWARRVRKRIQKREIAKTAEVFAVLDGVSQRQAENTVMKEALVAMRDADFSAVQMAEFLGVSVATVAKAIVDFGITMRSARTCISCGGEFRTRSKDLRTCSECRQRKSYKTARDRIKTHSEMTA